MKKMRKAFALILTLAIVMSLSVTAFAAPRDPKTHPQIVVTNPSSDIVLDENSKITAYKILNLTYDMDENADAFAYEVVDALSASTTYEYSPVSAYQCGSITKVTPANLVKYLEACAATPGALQAFAQDFVNNHSADLAKLPSDSVQGNQGSNDDYTIDLLVGTSASDNTHTGKHHSLGLGYYLIAVTQMDGADGSTVAPAIAVSLDTTDYDGEVSIKADAPTLKKEAKKGSDDFSVNDLTAAVGEVIDFKLSAKVPNTASYTGFQFTIKDDLSDNLVRDLDSMVVYLKDTNTDVSSGGEGVVLEGKYYTVTPGTDPDDFTVVFHDGTPDNTSNDMINFVNGYNTDHDTAKIGVGTPIIVTYSAKLTSKAVDTNRENNGAQILYSNDPTHPDGSQDPGHGNEDDPDYVPPKEPGTSPKQNIDVFDLQLNIKKVAEKKVPSGTGTAIQYNNLDGAVFALVKKTAISPAPPTGSAIKETFYKYAETTAEGENAPVYANGGSVTFVDDVTESTTLISDGGKMYLAEYNSGSKTYQKVTTPSAKALDFVGLDAGIYYLREIQTPKGYNVLTGDIKVVIAAVYNDTNVDSDTTTLDKVTYTFTDEAADQTVQNDANLTAKTVAKAQIVNGISASPLTIVNRAGNKLPSTGGIGTTIFYTVGGIMMVTALVLLITKKKVSAN